MKATVAEIGEKTDAIKAAMKRSGLWQEEPLKPEQYDFHRPFARDNMAYKSMAGVRFHSEQLHLRRVS